MTDDKNRTYYWNVKDNSVTWARPTPSSKNRNLDLAEAAKRKGVVFKARQDSDIMKALAAAESGNSV